jgi:hypothetical protein
VLAGGQAAASPDGASAAALSCAAAPVSALPPESPAATALSCPASCAAAVLLEEQPTAAIVVATTRVAETPPTRFLSDSFMAAGHKRDSCHSRAP